MDPALRKSVASFANAWGLNTEPPEHLQNPRKDYITPEAFEVFAAHYILNHHRHFGLASDDVRSLVTGGWHDTRIDAIAILANGMLIGDQEDLAVFEDTDLSDEVKVEFVFIQATLKEYLSQAKISNFCTGISNFLSTKTLMQESEQIVYWRGLKDKVLEMLERRGVEALPSCTLYMAWPETRQSLGRDHEATFELRREDIARNPSVSDATFTLLDGADLLQLVTADQISNKAILKFRGIVPVTDHDANGSVLQRLGMARASNGKAAWLGVIRASDFLDAITDREGALDDKAFYDNVRHFLGEKGGEVNEAIQNSIRHGPAEEFLFLNNGVTLVARKAELAGNSTLQLTDFQIVNGCQTTHSLHRNREKLAPDLMIPIKVVRTSDDKLMDRIVLASNSQTRIDPIQMLSRDPYVRRIQKHFEHRYPEDHPAHLKFERRAGEHADWPERHNARIIRIYDLLAGFRAIFHEQPHIVHRGVATDLLSGAAGRVFSPAHDPDIYYVAGLIMYRVRQWLYDQPGGERKYPARYHLALALRRLIEPAPGWADIADQLETPPKMSGNGGRQCDTAVYLRTIRHSLAQDRDVMALVARGDALLRQACEDTGRRLTSTAARSPEVTAALLQRLASEVRHS